MNKISNTQKMMMGVVMMALMMAMGAQGLMGTGTGSGSLLNLDLNLCLIKSVGQFKTFLAQDYLTIAELKAYLSASFPNCFPNGIFIGNPLGLHAHIEALDLLEVYLNLDGSAELLSVNANVSVPATDPAPAPSTGGSETTPVTIERNVNYWGNDITNKDNATSIEECIGWASSVEGALFVTYDRRSNQCWAKNSDSGRADDPGADSAKLASTSTSTSTPTSAPVEVSASVNVAGGVLAREILVLTINLALDAFNPNWCASNVPLAQLIIKEGPCAGLTLSQVLALANSIIAGGPLPDGITLDILVDVLVKINVNFRAALINNLYLAIPKLVALNVNLAC